MTCRITRFRIWGRGAWQFNTEDDMGGSQLILLKV